MMYRYNAYLLFADNLINDPVVTTEELTDGTYF